jgi:hypothetical protein
MIFLKIEDQICIIHRFRLESRLFGLYSDVTLMDLHCMVNPTGSYLLSSTMPEYLTPLWSIYSVAQFDRDR